MKPKRDDSTAGGDIAAFQNWMLAMVTHPEGPSVASTGEAARWIPLENGDVERIVLPSATLSGLERVGIYSGMYASRLVECLANDFPAVRHVADDACDAMLARFIADRPSKSWTLNRLGAPLPGWLKEHADELEHGDFLADLSLLERAIEEAFDAPQSPAMSADAILAIPREQWGAVRFECVPALRLLAFRFPVNAFYESFRGDEHPAVPRKKKSWLAVTRPEFQVFRHPSTALQFELLSALKNGACLADAIERCASDDAAAAKVFSSIGEWFKEWASAGFFAGVRV